MNVLKTLLGILAFFILMLFLASVFTIQQGQQGILLRLGRLVNDSQTKQAKVLQPGLHVKVPFIESVRVFDTRLQTLDIKSSRIVTREKKDVIVDYYVKWRIANLAHYFISTGGNEFKAETLLEQQLNTFLRAEFGKRTISDLVSGRDDVMILLREKAEQQARGLGIDVVDVRVKGIELPPNTSNAVYQLMRADMQKIANRHRADGIAEAEAIQASADAEVTILIAQAKSQGEIIRAQGQAEAAAIYNNAFSQNQDFFAFYRSLKAYEASLTNDHTLLVLDQSSAFFDYFKHSLIKGIGVEKKTGL
ncbi:HflC protein [Legionella beliardensis]|uniref:Protein HflC n=1 Tax=Legionella beliardensis TaxID=91822 RepID=A0A378HYS1_9GAMM|nr:protease modulator HflC [Legionella beliardensis]STX28049.1 HflC protein [Legionella beliardensis]